jgi:hypothetical protein
MTDSVAAISRLRAIAADLVERQHELAPWFAAALGEYESGARFGVELGEAFGLGLWWQIERRQRRDELLREIAAQHFPALKARAAAEEITARIGRYQASTWRTDRGLMSPSSTDPLRILLHRLLKLDQAVGFSTVRRALAQMVPVRLSHGACDAPTSKETECEHTR